MARGAIAGRPYSFDTGGAIWVCRSISPGVCAYLLPRARLGDGWGSQDGGCENCGSTLPGAESTNVDHGLSLLRSTICAAGISRDRLHCFDGRGRCAGVRPSVIARPARPGRPRSEASCPASPRATCGRSRSARWRLSRRSARGPGPPRTGPTGRSMTDPAANCSRARSSEASAISSCLFASTRPRHARMVETTTLPIASRKDSTPISSLRRATRIASSRVSERCEGRDLAALGPRGPGTPRGRRAGPSAGRHRRGGAAARARITPAAARRVRAARWEGSRAARGWARREGRQASRLVGILSAGA